MKVQGNHVLMTITSIPWHDDLAFGTCIPQTLSSKWCSSFNFFYKLRGVSNSFLQPHRYEAIETWAYTTCTVTSMKWLALHFGNLHVNTLTMS